MSLRQTSFPPADTILQLVSVDDAKKSRRIWHSREDDLYRRWILAAYNYLDGISGFVRCPLLEAEFSLDLCSFYSSIELPLPRVSAISAYSYRLATGGQPVVVNPATYELVTERSVQYLRAVINPLVPFIPTGELLGVSYPVTLTFKAGLSIASKDRPELVALAQAMLFLVGHFDANREATALDTRVSITDHRIQFGIEDLMRKYVLPLRIW